MIERCIDVLFWVTQKIAFSAGNLWDRCRYHLTGHPGDRAKETPVNIYYSENLNMMRRVIRALNMDWRETRFFTAYCKCVVGVFYTRKEYDIVSDTVFREGPLNPREAIEALIRIGDINKQTLIRRMQFYPSLREMYYENTGKELKG